MKHDSDRLKDLNNTLCPTESPPTSENIDTSKSTEAVGMINIPTLPLLPSIITEIRNVEKPQWIAPRPPQPMEIPDFASRHSNPFSIVGGAMITRDSFHIDPPVKKKRGQRGKDKNNVCDVAVDALKIMMIVCIPVKEDWEENPGVSRHVNGILLQKTQMFDYLPL